MILVPLSGTSSRGEQMLNAKSFQSKGYCEIVADDKLNEADLLLTNIDKVYKSKKTYIDNMEKSGFKVTNNTELAYKIMGRKE